LDSPGRLLDPDDELGRLRRSGPRIERPEAWIAISRSEVGRAVHAPLERYVRGLADDELLAAPGERYAYSNIAFDVLGDAIAKVSGQPFEAYVKAQLLAPLGMDDSTFLRDEVGPDLAVTPHFGAP
jgi:CubicO group peptidase (beta-lactamase class C family)